MTIEREKKKDCFYTYALAYPDGHFFYIGKGKGYRIRQHRTEARRIKTDGSYASQTFKSRVIRSLWASGQEYQEIILTYHTTEEEAFWHEIALIFLSGDRLANLTDGGQGAAGRVLTETHRQRISQAHMGKNFPHPGVARSETCRQKIRAKHQDRPLTEEHKLKIGAGNKDKVHSAEWNQKTSNTLKDRPHSEDRRRNIAKGRWGKSQTGE